MKNESSLQVDAVFILFTFEIKKNCFSFAFAPEQILSIRLKKTDRAYVESLSNRPLALIVCSQTYGGKSRFVNELLTEHLLPEPPKINETDLIRMIRIKVKFHSFERQKKTINREN